CIGTLAEIRGQISLCDPALLPDGTGLLGGKMANSQRGHVPHVVLQEELDALFVHDIAMFDAVRPESYGGLNRLGVGSMGHHLIATLATDGKGGLQLVIQKKRMPVPVPEGPHNAPTQLELDVGHAVLGLYTNSIHAPIRTVALP